MLLQILTVILLAGILGALLRLCSLVKRQEAESPAQPSLEPERRPEPAPAPPMTPPRPRGEMLRHGKPTGHWVDLDSAERQEIRRTAGLSLRLPDGSVIDVEGDS